MNLIYTKFLLRNKMYFISERIHIGFFVEEEENGIDNEKIV
jgi:hypothetical protein